MCDCDQPLLSRRGLLTAAALAAAGGATEAFLPPTAFGQGPPGGEETRTITGRFEVGAPDWAYLPVEVPAGVREIEVVYSYDRPTVPPGVNGNALDIGIFGPAGHDAGNQAGFRGWSGGFRDRFTISASAATPGYRPGPIDAGSWHVILGPYTVAPQGMNYRVDITLRYGPPGPAFVPRPAPERAGGHGRAWYRGDCHLHTQHSDGARWPDELAARAREADLDFIVSTEHNTPTASQIWGAHAGPDLLIVDGEEITTRSGHWLALGLPADYWIDWRYRESDPGAFQRFVDEVHGVGGIVAAAHPFCPFVGCAWGFGYGLVDAVEVWNGDWTLDDAVSVSTWEAMLRAGQWIPAIGNSDAHREPQRVGLPQTVVLADSLRTRDILRGIRAGRCWLAESSAVQLSMVAHGRGHRRATIGDRLDAGPGTPVELVLQVAGVPGCAVSLINQAGLQHVVQVDATGAAEIRWETRPLISEWVRAEIRRPVPTATTPDTMVALTNPIFLGRRG